MFGFESAVHGYGRYSRFLEAVARQFLFWLTSFYVDDGRLTDLRSSGQTGLQLLNCVPALLGTLAATHEALPMAARQQLLGTGHNLMLALTQGTKG